MNQEVYHHSIVITTIRRRRRTTPPSCNLVHVHGDRWTSVLQLLLAALLLIVSDGEAVPRFDPTALLRNVLVPADAAVGAVIYRLRASEPMFDYPLLFQVADGGGSGSVVTIDSLNCTRFNSVCQANVVLQKRLEAGRFYDFRVVVTSRRGFTNSLDCSFRATNATTPISEIFPGAATLLMVSENARRNTELGTLIAKGNPARDRPVLLELWGSPEFSLRQRLVGASGKDAEGTILLLGKLDYETRTVHHLTVLANDPWTDTETDTRNIAVWPLLVAVLDEQDTPPVFTRAPPTTNLDPDLQVGDLVLTVHAEDGDKGQPRDIRYSLMSVGNPFVAFFTMSEDTGELRLAQPLSDIQTISHTNTPIILTVIAEEVRSGAQELPAQSSSVRLALIPPTPTSSSPRFSAREFHTALDENSPAGTLLNITGAELISQAGLVFTLELVNNNNTFDVSPNVVEGRSKFMIKVRDSGYLDYEARRSVQCDIVAREIGDVSLRNLTAVARLVVVLNDVNDNPPVFKEASFQVELKENAEIGTSVFKVMASDVDGDNNEIRYTKLLGELSSAFQLDPITGVVTVVNSQALDAETTPTVHLQVEAADENGTGITAVADLTITLIDINDESPQFEKNPYEFILADNQRSFTIDAFIKAVDSDATSPNNLVRYELIEPVGNLTLNAVTGELQIRGVWTRTDVLTLRARAYDGGVPRLWSECEVRLYPPEGGHYRKMVFIVSGRDPDRRAVEEYLSTVAGGRVKINEIRPYTGREEDAYDFSEGGDRSVVYTTVTYSKDSVVDINRIKETLDRNSKQRREEVIKTKTSSSNNLWWLLLVVLLLLLLLALLLMLCCVLEGCPLYVRSRKRRKVASGEQLVVKVTEPAVGTESKSVQVAEWFGRREAWTPEGNLLETDVDSLRRHEMDRGSDRGGGGRRVLHKSYQNEPRDQLYIREGNADILRLITRGGEQQAAAAVSQRPVTLVQDQYVIDSGKDILLRRFIDQQQAEVARQNVMLPNAVTRLQTEHEMLEESLRQQNAMLRQILVEREREIRLETQSLPAGTQTDQNVSTQTEPLFLRPPRRQTRSDNDASDVSDEEDRKDTSNRRRRVVRKNKRKITTPIQEESESNYEQAETQTKSTAMATVAATATESRLKYGQTRASLLRKKAIDSAKSKSSTRSKTSSIKQEVLREISDSLGHSTTTSEEVRRHEEDADADIDGMEDFYSEDSLDESPRLEVPIQSKRYHSALDLRRNSKDETRHSAKSHSQSDLTKITKLASSAKPHRKKSTARYMEWYDGKKSADSTRRPSKSERKVEVLLRNKEPKVVESSSVVGEGKSNTSAISASKLPVSNKRVTTMTESAYSARRRIELPLVPGPVHPLIQHSKNRFEVNVLPARRAEEDVDSGIALTRPAMAQKKSVFTIAYADMQTQKLPESVNTP